MAYTKTAIFTHKKVRELMKHPEMTRAYQSAQLIICQIFNQGVTVNAQDRIIGGNLDTGDLSKNDVPSPELKAAITWVEGVVKERFPSFSAAVTAERIEAHVDALRPNRGGYGVRVAVRWYLREEKQACCQIMFSIRCRDWTHLRSSESVLPKPGEVREFKFDPLRGGP